MLRKNHQVGEDTTPWQQFLAFLRSSQDFIFGLGEGLNIVGSLDSNYTTCETAAMGFYNQTLDAWSILFENGSPINKALNVTNLLNLTYPLSTECYYGAFQSLERFSGVLNQTNYAITHLEETQQVVQRNIFLIMDKFQDIVFCDTLYCAGFLIGRILYLILYRKELPWDL